MFVLHTPKRLAPGCSGMRAEHVKAVLLDRNVGVAAHALTLLTEYVNNCKKKYGALKQYFSTVKKYFTGPHA